MDQSGGFGQMNQQWIPKSKDRVKRQPCKNDFLRFFIGVGLCLWAVPWIV
jgi:hypothetical protein